MLRPEAIYLCHMTRKNNISGVVDQRRKAAKVWDRLKAVRSQAVHPYFKLALRVRGYLSMKTESKKLANRQSRLYPLGF